MLYTRFFQHICKSLMNIFSSVVCVKILDLHVVLIFKLRLVLLPLLRFALFFQEPCCGMSGGPIYEGNEVSRSSESGGLKWAAYVREYDVAYFGIKGY
jgi:hypothetical protein